MAIGRAPGPANNIRTQIGLQIEQRLPVQHFIVKPAILVRSQRIEFCLAVIIFSLTQADMDAALLLKPEVATGQLLQFRTE